MKKRVFVLVVCLALAIGLSVGAYAASNLQQISAYLNYGIVIKYNGQTQVMLDAAGKRVYPITYNGTTYVPVRAISTILGVPVSWDKATQSVLLGENIVGWDFINDLKPYEPENPPIKRTIDGDFATIAGKTYDHFIKLHNNRDMFYNLEGQYKTLTFDVYCGSNYDSSIQFIGDEGEVLASIAVTPKQLPVTHTVDVENVQQFQISRHDGNYDDPVYIFNAIIK